MRWGEKSEISKRCHIMYANDAYIYDFGKITKRRTSSRMIQDEHVGAQEGEKNELNRKKRLFRR